MNSVRVSLYPSTVLGEFAEGGTMPKRAFLVLNGGHFQKRNQEWSLRLVLRTERLYRYLSSTTTSSPESRQNVKPISWWYGCPQPLLCSLLLLPWPRPHS